MEEKKIILPHGKKLKYNLKVKKKLKLKNIFFLFHKKIVID